MVNLVLGRQGTGKTAIIYNQINKCAESGEDHLLLIVPEQYTLEAEKELVRKLNLNGILHVEVISFSTLVQRVMEEVGGLTRTKLTNIGKQMAIQKIIDDHKNALWTYRGVINKVGLLEGIEEVISNMKKKGITSKTLDSFMQNYADNDILYHKLHDIRLISDSYDHWLGKNYLDQESAIDFVIENSLESLFLKNAKIWIDGFHTYTEQIYRLIEKLMILCKDITITLTHPITLNNKDKDLFEINNRTKEKLDQLSGNQIRTIHCYFEEKNKSPELLFLEKEFFCYSSKRYRKIVKDISIFECDNVYNEMDQLCLYIIDLVQNQNYRWKDICVLTNDLNGYEFLIKRYMVEYDIPCFIDTKRSIADKPLSILIMSTLKSIAYTYPYEEIFALIKSGLLGLFAEEYEMLENYVLKYGIKGYEWTSNFYRISEHEAFDLEELNRLRDSIIAPIETLKKQISKNRTYLGISSALYAYMNSLHIQEKMNDQMHALKAKFLWEYAEEFAQIYNMIIKLFDELVEIFGETPVTLKEYFRVFEMGIQSIKLAIIPSTLDQIIVGDITRSRNSEVKITCIIGANEGILPGQTNKNNIITDYESALLYREGLEIIEGSYHQSVQERYLLYNILSKGKDKIMISYPLANYEGSPLKPSIYIEQLKTIFPYIHVKQKYDNRLPIILNAKGSMKYMIEYYRGLCKNWGQDKFLEYEEVYLWYFKNEKYESLIKHIRDAFVFDCSVKNIDHHLVESIYGKEVTTSVTGLESYIQCPFKHFVTTTLKPKEQEIYQISIPDIGQLLHHAIHGYASELKKENLDWKNVDDAMMVSLCQQVIDKITYEYKNGIFQRNARYTYLKNYLNRLFYRSISTLTQHHKQGKYNILGDELVFGKGRELPSIAIEISQERTLYLEGRIDRIDVLRRDGKIYFKILDFKTGEKKLSLSDIYHGISLQLLVYMWSCLNYGKSQSWEAIPAGMFYFKLDDPLILSENSNLETIQNEIGKTLRLQGIMLKDPEVYKDIDHDFSEATILNYKINKNGQFSASSTGLIDEDTVYRLIDHVQSVIRNVGNGIFNGNIMPTPIKTKKFEACDYCQYKTICHYDPEFLGSEYNLKKDLDEEVVLKMLYKDKEDHTSPNEGDAFK
ncbi:MAG: PD-(D/E)XK nuclease family protein [Eubacteriales bacterium]